MDRIKINYFSFIRPICYFLENDKKQRKNKIRKSIRLKTFCINLFLFFITSNKPLENPLVLDTAILYTVVKPGFYYCEEK